MQKIVTDRIRPPGRHDPHGVEEARALLQTALDMIEADMASRTWAIGEAFTMADCAAAPALFYADKVMPFGETHRHAAAYLQPPDAAPVVRPRARGGAALFQDVPGIVGDRISRSSAHETIAAYRRDGISPPPHAEGMSST